MIGVFIYFILIILKMGRMKKKLIDILMIFLIVLGWIV